VFKIKQPTTMAYFTRDSDSDGDSYYEDNYYGDGFSSDDDWIQQEIEAMAGSGDGGGGEATWKQQEVEAMAGSGGGGGGGEKKEDENKCECKKCRETALGKHRRCNPNEYFEKVRRIEIQQLAEYTERNGHLAAADPQRHACGNGAVESRRHCILTHRGFTVHAPNPSAPIPYTRTDGGIAYVFAPPIQPGEVRNDDNFRNSFKTPEGMTIEHYRRLIDDYHLNQEQLDTPFAAFPRHHALAMASLSSTCATIESGLWATRKTGLRIADHTLDSTVRIQFYSPAYFERAFGIAKQHAQDPFEITRFTEMSGMQRNTVLAHSGIAGLVISRLFTSPCVPENQYGMSHMVCVKQSRVVARRVHSIEECEIFADNRYGKSGKYNGNPELLNANLLSRMMPDFKTQTLETARSELRVLYPREIHNILGMIRRLKRGLINVDEVRGNPVFHRMYALWLYCLKDLVAKQKDEDGDSRVKLIVDVMGFSAEFHLMYSTEMLSLYSKTAARFVKVSMAALLRLSSNASLDNPKLSVGCRAGILAFAAVEPRMVDQYLAPKLAICSFDGNDKEDALENHVPSRCPIFGELLKKFRVHMPRTGDCEWDICRKNGGMIASLYQ
jgi:hypothetical protein